VNYPFNLNCKNISQY